jgi:Recombination endonuclease VII
VTPEEKRLDGYYRRKFGWTLEEVNALDAKQNHVCAICHRPPGKVRLSLDHDHFFDRIKIFIERLRDWSFAAFLNETDASAIAIGATRKEVRKNAKRVLRRRSVRGLLCLRCNKGLQMFEDSKAPLSPAERFDNAAKYLRQFQGKFHEENTSNTRHGPDASSQPRPGTESGDF